VGLSAAFATAPATSRRLATRPAITYALLISHSFVWDVGSDSVYLLLFHTFTTDRFTQADAFNSLIVLSAKKLNIIVDLASLLSAVLISALSPSSLAWIICEFRQVLPPTKSEV
jgi:hypothetical protein